LIRSKDDDEYDFRIFGVHQVESRRQGKKKSGKPPTADGWLHAGGVPPSNVPSRITSPEPLGMDAGAEVSEVESRGVGSVSSHKGANVPYLDNIQSHLAGVDMPLVTPTGGLETNDTANSGSAFWPPLLDIDQRRWMNLDYGFNFQDQGHAQDDMLVQQIDPTAFDDFSRFLEQAGNPITEPGMEAGTEPFLW
jgi:hypothetical protein